MLNYNCIIKEDHLDIRKLSENVNIPLSKEDEKTLLQMINLCYTNRVLAEK